MAVEVCVGVLLESGRVLVRRRPRGSHLAGTWEFPGGKRRRGERGRACAEREMLEETGLRVAAGEEIARLRHDYGDRVVDLRFFACTPEGGRLRRSALLRRVTPAELLRLPHPAANRGVVAALATSRAAPPPPPPPAASGSGRRGRGIRSSPPRAR